jgi:hypothetical protein
VIVKKFYAEAHKKPARSALLDSGKSFFDESFSVFFVEQTGNLLNHLKSLIWIPTDRKDVNRGSCRRVESQLRRFAGGFAL